MSEKDKEEFEAFKKRSPKYNPGMNDQAEMDNESEDIQHHDIDNNKAIQNDLPDQKVDDKTIKMLLIKKKNTITVKIIQQKLKLNKGIL
ncbi:lipoprotein [Staphylococcus aureus]|uniref:Lipoprotein n=1 Tax=Staphylococcus aureus TaxID=1280 RepID=A0A2X2K415_STAAU|nr:lipoprotein [Staphylococcus aureus]